MTPPPGGAATYFNGGPSIFGFDFTSFNNGEQFSFNHDADIAGNGGYGADLSELLGTIITVDTTGGSVQGALGILINQAGARYVGASIDSPVPEPSTYALLGVGLGALALLRRRKLQK